MFGLDQINLANLLDFRQESGQIFLKGYRMVLLSACALGALREELIDTLGWEQCRGVMKRFGYAAGLADGKALMERFPEASRNRHLEYGPLLHALEGVAKVTRIPEKTAIDLSAGVLHGEAYWENSYEAEQHLAIFGKSEEPVCWTLMGYATGHSSAVAGRKTLVVEVECRAMGHERCRTIVDFDENFPAEFDLERRDYQALHLPKVLEELGTTIAQQQRSLQEKEKIIIHLQSQMEQQSVMGLQGASEALREALRVAELVAPVDSTVLILGESGTGKELVARGIHQKSRRADKPFIAVNCSALPETLQEAELFGFDKGAFTGATTARPGVFESANGGTLFLDEIGDLTLSAQTKILRALQEGEIKRIGENQIRKVDVRIIAATNQDLEKMVQEKHFREDLFYRLNVVAIKLPPLRERDNDALLLAEHFVKQFAKKFSKKVKGISRDAKHAIAAYSWPGNVRELQNAMERAVILAAGPIIELADLPEKVVRAREKNASLPMQEDQKPVAADDDRRRELAQIADNRERLTKALELAQDNREKAAALLGMSRTTLWRKMRQFEGAK